MDKHIAQSPIHSVSDRLLCIWTLNEQYLQPYECAQCEVRFISEALRKEHYLKSGAISHAVCYECSEGFEDADALLDVNYLLLPDQHKTYFSAQHSKIVHPTVYCKVCKIHVLERDLGKHWTESTKHPTCTTCKVSFESDDTFEQVSAPRDSGDPHILTDVQHLFEVHPELCCRSCEFASRIPGGLQKHYDTTSLHPKCPLCDMGFSTIVSLDKHVCSVPRQVQPRIIAVERLSSSSSAATLQTSTGKPHYRDHSAHPTCRPCNIGFKDSTVYDLHVSLMHSAPPNYTPIAQSTMQSPPAADPSGVPAGVVDDRHKEQSLSADDTPEEPVAYVSEPTSIPEVAEPPEVEVHNTSDEAESTNVPSAPSTPRSESNVPELTRLVIEAPHYRARASSEPPLSSVFGPPIQNTEDIREIVIEVKQTSEPPIHTEEPDIAPEVHAEHDVCTISPPPLSTTVESVRYVRCPRSSEADIEYSPNIISSVTPSAGGTPQAVLPQLKPITTLPVPVRPPSIFSPPGRSPYDSPRRFPFRWGGESPVSESTSAPVTPSPTRSLLFSRTFVAAPPAQTEIQAEQQHNVSNTNDNVPRRASRAPSVASVVSTPSVSSASSSRRHRPKAAQAETTVTPTTATSTSHTHVEHEDAPSRTPPEIVAEQKPAAPAAITAPLPRPALSWDCRVCAHPPTAPTTTLCIMLELQKHGQCPVCRRAVLVRLHVEA
ncbi:hypothetical protein EIP86_000946 [Pleurotus ostreatoroseus]|nr:hypothetical protein EIP86_000946 [Pleurotus ostreatoroseus]